MYPEVFDAPGSEKLLAAFREKHCAYFEHEDRDRFANLLSWDVINNLLSLNLFDSKRLRVVKEGRSLPRGLYGRDKDRRPVDSEKLTGLLEQGASLVIDSAQLLVPEVRRITGQFERWLDQKINVNCYMSFKNGGAFSSHFDTHDVLVMQVHGDKLWTIYGDPEAYPMEGHSPKVRNSGTGRPVAMELLLRSGDMLFVPRGFVHKAAVQDGTSVHLTFGIPSPQSIELLDLLRTRCMQIDEFRKDVIAVVGPEALAEQGSRVKALLHKMIDELSLDDVLEERRRKREAVDYFQLGPNKALSRNAVLHPLIRKREGVSYPAAVDADLAGRVMDRLVDNHSMKLGDLCDSFAGEIDADVVESTMQKLVTGRLVELAR